VKPKIYEAPHYAVFQPPVSSSVLDPNVLLSTLFSNTVNLFSNQILLGSSNQGWWDVRDT